MSIPIFAGERSSSVWRGWMMSYHSVNASWRRQRVKLHSSGITWWVNWNTTKMSIFSYFGSLFALTMVLQIEYLPLFEIEMQQRCQFFAISRACLHWQWFYRLSTCLCLKLKCNKDVNLSLFRELVCIDDGTTDGALVFVWPRWNEWLVRGVDDSFIDVVIVGIQLELNDGSNEMQQRYEFVFTFNI